ncbi:MAG TPA: hypothetical protein VF972_07300 [Actinomycetota bacterium]
MLLLVTPAAGAPVVLPVASDGHPTHPVWYHDSTAVQVGSLLHLAWNTNHAAVEARTYDRSVSSWATGPVQVSGAVLDGGCVDSTGTNPNRHDVPTLFADPGGRVYALYGGGTASWTGHPSTGPYFRAATTVNSIQSWGPEQLLSIPGAAYDFESVRDNLGVNHLIGQQGGGTGGHAGSLVYLRLLPGTSTASGSFAEPYRILVQGGFDPAACSWQATAGCDIFVIGRIAVAPADPKNPSAPAALYVTWGWSEKNLSNTCGDPSGFCDRGLSVAVSRDGGSTWSNVSGTVTTNLATAAIPYDDPDYQVLPPSANVGLFKAIVVSGSYPGTPWIAHQPGAGLGSGTITVTGYSGGAWTTQIVDSSRGWNNHLVMRPGKKGAIYLWSDIAQSGSNASNLYQWLRTSAGGSWARSSLSVGPNWFLTGRSVPNGELLMWRTPIDASSSGVAFAIVPVS